MENKPYYKIDHSHCWESDNPPCGIERKHRCCLCKEPAPADWWKEGLEECCGYQCQHDIPETHYLLTDKDFEKIIATAGKSIIKEISTFISNFDVNKDMHEYGFDDYKTVSAEDVQKYAEILAYDIALSIEKLIK